MRRVWFVIAGRELDFYLGRALTEEEQNKAGAQEICICKQDWLYEVHLYACEHEQTKLLPRDVRVWSFVPEPCSNCKYCPAES